MVDKNFDIADSREKIDTAVPSKELTHQHDDADIFTDMQSIETKLNKDSQFVEEDSTIRKIHNELLNLSDEIKVPVQREKKGVDLSGWLPPTIKQSFDQAQQQYGRSEEVKIWREDAYRRVQSLESDLPSWLVTKANA